MRKQAVHSYMVNALQRHNMTLTDYNNPTTVIDRLKKYYLREMALRMKNDLWAPEDIDAFPSDLSLFNLRIWLSSNPTARRY
jgi:hypothetical protein